MLNKNLVSVIIPLYNAQNTIIKCIQSVLSQLPNDQIEIIVIDDGSTDESNKVVNSFIKDYEYNNITLISQKNKGVSAARNVGIKSAKGDYIALIDSDDIWLENKLKHQLSIFQQFDDIDFVGTMINNLTLGFPYKLHDELFEVTFNRLMLKMAPSTITAMFKKALIEKSGLFDETQKYSEDLNLWLRFSKQGKMVIINKNYAIAGDYKPTFGHSGLSGNLRKMFEGEKKNIKDMRNLKYINYFKYIFYRIYITLKYLRRITISKIKN